MEILSIIIKICVLVMAAFLVVAVLMQEGKSEGLSGALSGAADSSFGKNKENGGRIDAPPLAAK